MLGQVMSVDTWPYIIDLPTSVVLQQALQRLLEFVLLFDAVYHLVARVLAI